MSARPLLSLVLLAAWLGAAALTAAVVAPAASNMKRGSRARAKPLPDFADASGRRRLGAEARSTEADGREAVSVAKAMLQGNDETTAMFAF